MKVGGGQEGEEAARDERKNRLLAMRPAKGKALNHRRKRQNGFTTTRMTITIISTVGTSLNMRQ